MNRYNNFYIVIVNLWHKWNKMDYIKLKTSSDLTDF